MDWLRIHVSNLCNFKCPNCHVFELGENNLPNRVMSQEIFNQSIDQFLNVMKLRDHTHVTVSLYGGETLANKKIIKAGIERYGKNCNGIQIHWVLNTNGSLLSEEDVIFFHKNDVELHVSVDGEEEIHNLSRPTHKGKGTFHMVTPALEFIRDHSAPAQINSYMMPSNYLHLKQIVDIAEKYNIKKIYLDQFYNLDMISHKIGMEKYREIFFYAAQKGITISGPWAKVIDRFQKGIARYNELIEKLAIDVNIDGTYYFPFYSASKNTHRHIANLTSDLIQNEVWNDTVNLARNVYTPKCQSCSIKDHCFGSAIEQVFYHIGEDADTKVSCDFFRDWCQFLMRPIYIDSQSKFDIVSTYPISALSDLTAQLQQIIIHLENLLWPLKEKIILNVFQYSEELRLASHQYNLPDWVRATTYGSRNLFHLGVAASPNLIHEVTHFFIIQSNLLWPKWFTEGFCEYMQNQDIDRDLVKKHLQENNLFQDRVIEKVDFITNSSLKPESNTAYIQAKAFVVFAIDKVGFKTIIKPDSVLPFESLMKDFQENYLSDIKKI